MLRWQHVLIASTLCACGGGSQYHPRSPRDIKTVRIGEAVWMAENLDVDHYRNGETIPEARDWRAFNRCIENAQGCWISYARNKYVMHDNDASTQVYGVFYNFYAMSDSRGLCPAPRRSPQNRPLVIG